MRAALRLRDVIGEAGLSRSSNWRRAREGASPEAVGWSRGRTFGLDWLSGKANPQPTTMGTARWMPGRDSNASAKSLGLLEQDCECVKNCRFYAFTL